MDTSAPIGGPFPPSQRRTDREWVETSIKPGIAGQMPLWAYGTGYTSFSFVAQGTRGNGDALSSLAQAGSRSTTDNSPTHVVGAFYTSLTNDFERAAIVKLNPDSLPVRGNLFKLEDRSDQRLMKGFDQAKAKLAGFNADWFKAGE